MRIAAVFPDARGERRPTAAALALLARHGHSVTLCLPRWAPRDDLEGVARFDLAPRLEDGSEPPGALGATRDADERMRLSRAALPACEAADALLLDVASGLATVPTYLEGRRKVALLLDAPETTAEAREPNLGDDDLARIDVARALAEHAERRCDASVVPHEAARARSFRSRHARICEPAADLEAAAAAAHAGDLLECGRPIIAALAPPTPAHGFDHLLRAFAEIRSEASRATLVLAAATHHILPARKGFREAAIERICPAHADAILSRDDSIATARAVLASADLCVHAPLEPGGGAPVAEALAAGVPLVASERDPFAGALASREAALLVPPGDPLAIARAACRLSADRPAARSQAARGKALARERFSLERLADDLLAALEGR
jgi:hypothetical protein